MVAVVKRVASMTARMTSAIFSFLGKTMAGIVLTLKCLVWVLGIVTVLLDYQKMIKWFVKVFFLFP